MTKRLLTGFFALLTFASCKKEIDSLTVNPPITDSSFLVKSSVSDKGEEINYFYDAQKRITSLEMVKPRNDKSVFTYNSNNTYTVDNFSNNVATSKELHFVNGNGFVDSIVRVNSAKDTTVDKFVYDANKIPVIKRLYKITDGQPVSINTITTEYDATRLNATRISDNANKQAKYDYYIDYANTLNTGLFYFQQNRNLIKTAIYTEAGVTRTQTHSYTFDSINRITGEKVVNESGAQVSSKTYRY